LKTKSILFIYGVGGHKEQMKRLINILDSEIKGFNKIALIEKDAELDSFDKIYTLPPARGKFSYIKSIIAFPFFLIYSFFIIFKILLTSNIKVIISTGPGIALVPSLIFRILGKKVIFIETWSRFNTTSITGKLMYKIATVFYIQNKELLEVYPTAIYSGRL
jgi:UDP-N-acetylglucosamine:LPS N-acetylglucosamine transferase